MKYIRILLFFPMMLWAVPSLAKYEPIIEQACKETKVPTYILKGLIYAESDGVVKAVSYHKKDPYRDEGIVQLNSRYLSYFRWRFNKGVKIDPYDPIEAIPIAARILAFNYKYFGNWTQALAAYRQGITGVKRNGVTSESLLYVDKIILSYR
jgi:soluble lytic murein transglycosylase-like protein